MTVDRVQKLIALATHNPSEHEARSAALLACKAIISAGLVLLEPHDPRLLLRAWTPPAVYCPVNWKHAPAAARSAWRRRVNVCPASSSRLTRRAARRAPLMVVVRKESARTCWITWRRIRASLATSPSRALVRLVIALRRPTRASSTLGSVAFMHAIYCKGRAMNSVGTRLA